MSVLSQFFPGGSAGEGFIEVQALIVSGGGGGGGTYPTADSNFAGGGGGGGAVFYGYIPIKPGSTCPIVVGAGGAGGGAPGLSSYGDPGSNGSDSSITTPVTTILVAGGGGGGASLNSPGLNGGTGGGGGGLTSPAPPRGSGDGGKSIYYSGGYTALAVGDAPALGADRGTIGGNVTSNKYGTFHGYPGSGAVSYYQNPGFIDELGSYQGGGAGGAGGSLTWKNWFSHNIAGISSDYGMGRSNPFPSVSITYPVTVSGANLGSGGLGAYNPGTITGSSGSSGVVILKYPTQFAAAPSFPGATDLSPSTPGFRTYRFTSPGSITLP